MDHIIKYLLLSLILIVLGCNLRNTREVTFYVALDGNDQWSGKLAAPNADRTDGPFATFARAREAVRQLKSTGIKPLDKINVCLRGGVYFCTETFTLTAEDSGTAATPVVWGAAGDEQVILSGSKLLQPFQTVTEPQILKRLSPAAQTKVYVTDLKAQGINDFGSLSARGGPGPELFFNGERMTLARWPNAEWLKITEVPQTGPKMLNPGLEREKRYDNVPVGRHYGRICYQTDRLQRWAPVEDIYLHGYFTWDWYDTFQKVATIDAKKCEITLAEPHHHYGYTKNQRFYFVNILEELDQPGEWYLDRQHGWLYFWPPAPLESAEVKLSQLQTPFFVLENCQYVTLQNFTFEASQGKGVVVNGGAHNLIAGSTFRNLGDVAVTIDGGAANGVSSCDFYELALGGIVLRGGDRATLTPAGNFAINNHIHHYSHWIRTSQNAITVEGVGNRVAHNLVHDAPHCGIYFSGNEHLIEYNEIHSVVQETGDAGAIYTGRDWTWQGNIIRYNYLHHLAGAGLHGVMGVYLDDFSSGFTVYGNLFYRAGRATLLGGGRDNLVENNLYIECAPSIHLDARGLSWASNYFDGQIPVLFERLAAMNFEHPPYSEKYPALLQYPQDEPGVPKNNRILRNISWGGRWMDIYDYQTFDLGCVTIQDNLIADSIVCRRRLPEQTGWDPYYLNIDLQTGYGAYRATDTVMQADFKGNRFFEGNPGLVDPANGNFELKPDAPALAMGFKPLPYDQMGLIRDTYRKTLPARAKLE